MQSPENTGTIYTCCFEQSVPVERGSCLPDPIRKSFLFFHRVPELKSIRFKPLQRGAVHACYAAASWCVRPMSYVDDGVRQERQSVPPHLLLYDFGEDDPPLTFPGYVPRGGHAYAELG